MFLRLKQYFLNNTFPRFRVGFEPFWVDIGMVIEDMVPSTIFVEDLSGAMSKFEGVTVHLCADGTIDQPIDQPAEQCFRLQGTF